MLGAYSEGSAAIFIIFFTFLSMFVFSAPVNQKIVFVSISMITLTFLFWKQGKDLNSQFSVLGLIPGHYLLIFALGLQGSFSWITLPIWSAAIIFSLAFSIVTSSTDLSGISMLTSAVLYCIIWGAVSYLINDLLKNGLPNNMLTNAVVTGAIVTFGIIYVSVGLYRIVHQE